MIEPLTWTKTMPTEPGWYWRRGARVEILEVTREDGCLWVHNGVRSWELNDSWSMSEWAGPIPLPDGTFEVKTKYPKV